MDYWHLTVAAEERHVLFDGSEQLSDAAARLAAMFPAHTLFFCAVDDHLHLVLRGTRREAGQAARCVRRWLRATGRTVAPCRVRPISSRSHLERSLPYVLRQSDHHGLQGAPHPALWPGSTFLDLVGARLLKGFQPQNLARALPCQGSRKLPSVSPGKVPSEPGLKTSAFEVGHATEFSLSQEV